MGKKRFHFGCHLICRACIERQKRTECWQERKNKIKFTAFICEFSSKYATQNLEDASSL
jgi:hypothetical protein